jgi:hypothetical protein
MSTNLMTRRGFLRVAGGAAGAAALAAAGTIKAGDALADSWQPGWIECYLCHEVAWGGSSYRGQGKCPAQPLNGHAPNSGHYQMLISNTTLIPGQQAGWRWCRLCQALFWPQYGTGSFKCVATGNSHQFGSNTVYAVPVGRVGTGEFQAGYNACSQCGTLYFSNNGWGTRAGICWFGTRVYGYQVPHIPASATEYQMAFA